MISRTCARLNSCFGVHYNKRSVFAVRDYTRYNYRNYDMFRKHALERAIEISRQRALEREISCIDE